MAYSMYDIIIIGAGPAGITASVYAARKKMKVLVITMDVGGQAAWSGDIENYTGYQFITGPDLAEKFEEHLRRYDITVKENEAVLALAKKGETIEIKTEKGTYESKTAIIASGKRSRELNVPGEKEYKNRGLTYCATCDGPLFSGKDVAIIGGGNSALDAALQMVNIAGHVYIVDINPKLGGDPIMLEKVVNNAKVTVINNASVAEIKGEKTVTAIKVKTNGTGKEIPVQGVFVEIGLTPNSEFAVDIDKNEHGEIKVNCYNETNVPGIFA
ncbi:MAG: FAD-dependent oxidoreductase, partial [Candidatus Omnitrophota bacterium]|nr:FAD-dependent oxidoreductase [Candidatus Omnitrophota bacterium]